MKRQMFATGAVIGLLGGCTRTVYVQQPVTSVFAVDSVQAGMTAKVIVAKKRPDTLIAADGSRCVVNYLHFAVVDSGAVERCAWQDTKK